MSTDERELRLQPHLIEVRSGPVRVLRIDREAALGALSREILETLRRYLAELADSDARVLVITGTGKGFVAGADIEEYVGVTHRQFVDYQSLGRQVFDAIADLPQFTIAAVNGYALGGGFELALACDVMIAAERARFGLPEVKLGLLPGGGGTQRLSRSLGTRFTKELVATGRFVAAPELFRRGLLASVHPADELLAAARLLADTVASNAPLPVRAATALIDRGMTMSITDALTEEQRVLAELYTTADASEGIAAFVEKREPHFRGR